VSSEALLTAFLGLLGTVAIGVTGWIKLIADGRIKRQAALDDQAVKDRDAEAQRLTDKEARIAAEEARLDQEREAFHAELRNEVQTLRRQVQTLEQRNAGKIHELEMRIADQDALIVRMRQHMKDQDETIVRITDERDSQRHRVRQLEQAMAEMKRVTP
jgi:chromosome segregation ATPase